MRVNKLVWGFINRYMIWGMCSGWLIGFAIPAYLSILMALSPSPLQESVYDRWAVGGYILIFGVGTGCIGCIVGGTAGFVNGWMVGMLTKRQFYPVSNELVYRSAVGAISVVVSLGGVFLFCSIWTMRALQVAAIFAAIASVAGLLASQVIATWYLRIQPRSSNAS